MDVKPNDWSQAQGLLVLLAQTLTFKAASLEEGMAGFGPQAKALFLDRIYKKPAPPSAGEKFQHSVRLLPTLRVAQKQMEQWIETIPAEEKPAAPPIRREARPEIAPAPTEMPRPLPASKPILSNPQTPSDWERLIAAKAGKLIEEVRLAIQTLSSSSFLCDPKPAPIRAALAKLKPLIDEFIEALSETGLDPHPDAPFKEKPRFEPQALAPDKSDVPPHLLQESLNAAAPQAKRENAKLQSGRKEPAPVKTQDMKKLPKTTDDNRSEMPLTSEPKTKETADHPSRIVRLPPEKPLFQLKKDHEAQQKTLQPPVSIHNPLAGQLLRAAFPLKKKRPRRYFFKDDEENNQP